VVNGDTIQVAAGTYAEALVITKQVTIDGAQAGQGFGSRLPAFTSGKADPTKETILTAPTVDPSGTDLIRVAADNVKIDGLVIDGNNPTLSGGTSSNGVLVDARRGITNLDGSGNFVPVNNLLVQNDIIQNISQRGVSLNNGTSGVPTSSTGNLIIANYIRNYGIDSSTIGAGVVLFGNAYADVENNTIDDVLGGQTPLNAQNFSGTGSMTWQGNIINAGQDTSGITVNNFSAPSGSVEIIGNTVNAAAGVTGTDDFTWGIYLATIQNGASVTLTGNTIGATGGQFARGINLWNLPTPATVSVLGGSVGNSVIGIDLDSVDGNFGVGAATTVIVNNVTLNGDTTGVRVEAVPFAMYDGSGTTNPTSSVEMILTGLNIQNATTGLLLAGDSSSVTATAPLVSNIITKNTTGIETDNFGSYVATTASNLIFNNGTNLLDKRTPPPALTFVDKVYRDLFPRVVDPAGEAYWSGLVNAGVSRSQVVYQIEVSPPGFEYYALRVEQMYVQYLHRTVDPSGFSYGVSILAGGGSVEQLAATIIASPEYYQVRGGGTNTGFLTALYADVLNRALDPTGASAWGTALLSGASRAQVAYGILTSTEARGDQIAYYYANFLHRTASASDLQFWEGQFKQGASDQLVIANILGSQEYLGLS
jgi:hypothetical protein